MIRVIHCSGCGKNGSLPVVFSVRYKNTTCGSCYHIDTADWKYHFCNAACFQGWFAKNEVAEKGIHCYSCMKDAKSTGFAYGFKTNGVCKTCNGKKRVLVG